MEAARVEAGDPPGQSHQCDGAAAALQGVGVVCDHRPEHLGLLPPVWPSSLAILLPGHVKLQWEEVSAGLGGGDSGKGQQSRHARRRSLPLLQSTGPRKNTTDLRCSLFLQNVRISHRPGSSSSQEMFCGGFRKEIFRRRNSRCCSRQQKLSCQQKTNKS